MLRRFTKAVGRFQAGTEHDYPRAVWAQIARSAEMDLDKFTQTIDNNVVLQSPLKGRVVIHKRLGSKH